MAEKKGKILVVDDERGIREGCRRVLSSAGYQVDVAESGEEGFEKVKKEQFDLVFVDLKMPGMDGVELIQRVLEYDPEIVCVVITAYATLEAAVATTKLGAYDFVAKPFTPDELLSLTAKALEKRWLSLEAKRLREERERRLLEITTEQTRLRTIINCMVDGVLVTNRDGELVLYNPAFWRMVPMKEQAGVGKPIAECLANEELNSLILNVLSSRDSGYSMVSRELSVGDHGEVVVMANIASVRDERGEILGSVTVLRDISRLKELDKMKSEFISLVAHELRSPLAAIENYLEVVISGAAGNDPEKNIQMLKRARERASALLELIEDLLDISRMEAGKVARNLQRLQISEVVRETVELMRGLAEEKKIQIQVDLPQELPEVNADREDMCRLFTNLLSNAIKYNRAGGSVSVKGRVERIYLRIDVSDTGIGISKEDIPRLFDDFYRVNRPETRYTTGTGLGLSIVKKIIEAHHGYVQVESELNKGSTFSVYLPFVQ